MIGNRIDDKGAREVAEFIQNNQTIQDIKLTCFFLFFSLFIFYNYKKISQKKR